MTPTGPLETKIAALKLIARDALRMNLISPRLSAISSIQNSIKNIQEQIANNDHTIIVLNYEISKLDQNHPDYAIFSKNKTDRINSFTEMSANLNKDIVAFQKEIDEEKAGIAKIESGETKVSIDDLNQFVERLVKEDAFKQVNQ